MVGSRRHSLERGHIDPSFFGIASKKKKILMISISIKLKAFDSIFLENAKNSICFLGSLFSSAKISEISFPSKLQKFTVIRSPHIDKASREQFQRKTEKKMISFSFQSFQQAIIFISFVKNFQCPGIEVEIQGRFFEYFQNSTSF